MQEIGIGELARRTGVASDPVRYYERHRLLLPVVRSASGYRRYREPEVARLRFHPARLGAGTLAGGDPRAARPELAA